MHIGRPILHLRLPDPEADSDHRRVFLTATLLSIAAGPFVEVDEARALIAADAVVLDARGGQASAPFVPRAQVVNWLDVRDGWLRTGRLTDDESRLRRYFERRGVDARRPVLVYGAMGEGWGEEGRIWWTLQYLGHPRARILNGGIHAWVRAGATTVRRTAPPSAPGKLGTALRATSRADWKQVQRSSQHRDATVVDVRTRAEYDGATPYWSSRGGHVPGARWLYWKDLLGTDGRLLPDSVLAERFTSAGLVANKPVITYCTGGVRSAFVLAALRQAGFTRVANYDGSWWDWARRKAPVE